MCTDLSGLSDPERTVDRLLRRLVLELMPGGRLKAPKRLKAVITGYGNVVMVTESFFKEGQPRTETRNGILVREGGSLCVWCLCVEDEFC